MVDHRDEDDLGIDTIGIDGAYVDVSIVRCDCRMNTRLVIVSNLRRLHYLQTIYIDTGVLVRKDGITLSVRDRCIPLLALTN